MFQVNSSFVSNIKSDQGTAWQPAISVLVGAIVWGLIWYPYRVLTDWGLPGTLSSFLTFVVALLLALMIHRKSALIRPDWIIVAMSLTAGLTNVGFVWATIHGEVMRVVLLFYLMPVWTAGFAWLILGERISRMGALLCVTALCGAALILWNPELGEPWPRGIPEWIGLLAGVNFALSNVLSRKAKNYTSSTKSVWLLAGCAVIGLIGSLFSGSFSEISTVVPMLSRQGGWLIPVLLLLLGLVLMSANTAMQYGLQQLPANRIPLICLFELVVAGLSAWLLAGERLGLKEILGASLIITASVLSHRISVHQ